MNRVTAFLLILGVPFLGVLLYVAESQRRYAQTPGGRSLARHAILILGALLGVAGGLTLLVTVGWIVAGVRDRSVLMAIVTFLTQMTAGVQMLWAARSALRVYRLPQVPYDVNADLIAEQQAEELRLSSMALVLVPLVLLGFFGLIVAVPVILWGVTFWMSRRARETQFLWTLALAVRHQLPLANEVEAFAQPLWSRRQKAYQGLANRLRDGRSLGDALEMSTGVLPRSVSSEIRAAEEAGTLPTVLTEMATSYTSSLDRSRFDNSLAVALLYGWSLLAMILCVFGFIMYWIIPKFKSIFEDFGMELPPLTVGAIRASDVFSDNFLMWMPLIGLPAIAALAGAFVYFVGWGNLNVPLLMRWFPRADAPPLLRTLSHAVGASRPLPETISDMAHRHLRSDMRGRLLRISESFGRGEPVWQSLEQEGFIRSAEADALAAAQRAGNLPWGMRTLAEAIERTRRHRVQFWLEIVKPSLVVGIGLIVGWFVIAMFLPLVKLISALA